MPCALQEWLPQGHLAYFIHDTVDHLDLRAFHARQAGGGPRNQPFHPAMLVKVLVYTCASGVFRSRKIAKCNLNCHQVCPDFGDHFRGAKLKAQLSPNQGQRRA